MRSAQAAGIERTTVYARQKASKTFAAQMAEAEKDALEELELEAYRRAVHGTKRPVWFKGERCGFVREYSDTLLVVLLKARAPEKYRENTKIEHAGSNGGPIQFTEVIVEMPPESEDADE